MVPADDIVGSDDGVPITFTSVFVCTVVDKWDNVLDVEWFCEKEDEKTHTLNLICLWTCIQQGILFCLNYKIVILIFLHHNWKWVVKKKV